MTGLSSPGAKARGQSKLLKDLRLFEPIKERIENGLPVFGTCAGMILLAENIDNDENRYFVAMPMTVRRNAYGRQLGSFYTESEFCGKTIIGS